MNPLNALPRTNALFGNTNPPGPSGGSLFGNPQPQSSLFGNPSNQTTTQSPFFAGAAPQNPSQQSFLSNPLNPSNTQNKAISPFNLSNSQTQSSLFNTSTQGNAQSLFNTPTFLNPQNQPIVRAPNQQTQNSLFSTPITPQNTNFLNLNHPQPQNQNQPTNQFQVNSIFNNPATQNTTNTLFPTQSNPFNQVGNTQQNMFQNQDNQNPLTMTFNPQNQPPTKSMNNFPFGGDMSKREENNKEIQKVLENIMTILNPQCPDFFLKTILYNKMLPNHNYLMLQHLQSYESLCSKGQNHAQVNENDWKKAMEKNPDKESLFPIFISNPIELKNRVELTEKMINESSKTLNETTTKINDLISKYPKLIENLNKFAENMGNKKKAILRILVLLEEYAIAYNRCEQKFYQSVELKKALTEQLKKIEIVINRINDLIKRANDQKGRIIIRNANNDPIQGAEEFNKNLNNQLLFLSNEMQISFDATKELAGDIQSWLKGLLDIKKSKSLLF